MKKVQLAIHLLGLLVAVSYFVFTLGFSTNWAVGQMFGDFFLEAQIANKEMFRWALGGLVFAGLCLVFRVHLNRKFFLSNYILSGIFIIYLIGSAVTTLSHMEPLKAMYLELDEFMLTLITAINYGKISTQIFDIGVVLSYIMFIQAGLVAFMMVYKFVIRLKRAKAKKLNHMEVVA
ncbi:MAG: hypothetical protein NUK62_01220 [Tenericutes bacterium]|nr:hypothetical protein [Mycoplasmatota bacterium]